MTTNQIHCLACVLGVLYIYGWISLLYWVL